MLAMLVSESSIYGVLLVSGLLVVVVTRSNTDSAAVLAKVLGSAVVFWLAHVYAGAVSHLGDAPGPGQSHVGQLKQALRDSVGHMWGTLAAPIVPALALCASLLGWIGQEQAIWATLWLNVALLAVLGFWGVSRWSGRLVVRLAGAATTAGLGLVLVLMKALIH